MELRYNQNLNQRRPEMNHHQENNYRNDQNHDHNYRNQAACLFYDLGSLLTTTSTKKIKETKYS